MFQPWKQDLVRQSLSDLKKASMLQGVHWVAKGFFKARGYQWELRRNGDIKLGYWKKTLKPRDQRDPYPKRFVLVPGFGDTPLSWHIVISLLQPVLKRNDFNEVILFDFPGFGGFLWREKAFPSIDLMMSVFEDALDSLKPHTILGHSLGGWLSAHYAALCGQGVRPTSNRLNYSGPQSVLLANPSGIFSNDVVKEEWANLFRSAMKEGFPALRPHLFAKEPSWFRYMVPHFARFLAREDIIQFMDSVQEQHLMDTLVPHIQSEVWLLWGQQDTLIPPCCAETWLEHLPHSQLDKHHAIFLKNAGHSPHLETPAVTAAVIGQIISKRKPHRMGRRWWTHLEKKASGTS